MKFQKQLFRHNPPETFGDCARTVLACFLDLTPEEIPNFGEHYNDIEAFCKAETAFLHSKGFTYLSFAYLPEHLETLHYIMREGNPGLYYILSGTSKSGCNHVVICLDGTIVWDTSLTDAGIIGPCDLDRPEVENKFYFVSYLIPLAFSTKIAT